MADTAACDAAVVLLATHWSGAGEAPYVTRSLAGALATRARLTVATPGAVPAPPRSDGAFDVHTISLDRPPPLLRHAAIVVLATPLPAALADLARRNAPKARLILAPLGDGGGSRLNPELVDAVIVPTRYGLEQAVNRGFALEVVHDTGMFVATNPVAARDPLVGAHCNDYLLVLSDRQAPGGRSSPAGEPVARSIWPARMDPVDTARWIIAAFPRRQVAVVDSGVVTIWHSRRYAGHAPVGTRTDLWRLMARAWVTIDLSPGRVMARECIESLMFGTPIVVPTGSVAAEHARGQSIGASGRGWVGEACTVGRSYSDLAELIDHLADLEDPDLRDSLGGGGRRYATDRYGSPERFAAALAELLDETSGSTRGEDGAPTPALGSAAT
ncbi:MAG: glycosyltransferase [Acidimicrobiales bacterium]